MNKAEKVGEEEELEVVVCFRAIVAGEGLGRNGCGRWGECARGKGRVDTGGLIGSLPAFIVEEDEE